MRMGLGENGLLPIADCGIFGRQRCLRALAGWAFMLASLLCVAAGASFADEHGSRRDDLTRGGPREQPAQTEADGIVYRTQITGDAPSEVISTFESVSSLITMKDRLPRTKGILRRRVRQDEARLVTILRSEGYYDESIKSSIEEDTEGNGLLVTLDIETGKVFKLKAYDVTYSPKEEPEPPTIPLEDLKLKLGEPARAADITAAEGLLLRRLQNKGYAFPKITEKRYIVDHATTGLRAELTVDPGPEVTFGKLTITGLEAVHEDYIRRLLAWPAGTKYRQSEIKRVRRLLVRSGLFDGVTVKAADEASSDGSVPVTAELQERPQRSVGAFIGYSTDVLGNGGVFWEHRNLFGNAESLRAELAGSFIRQSATLSFRKPEFPIAGGALLGRVEVANETSEAFEGETALASAAYEQRFSDVLSGSGGIDFEYNNFDDRPDDEVGETQTVSFPFFLTFDDRDSSLNPTKGIRARGGVEPAVATSEDGVVNFVTNTFTLSGYQSFFEGNRLVLAARVGVGAIYGASRSDIPASQRLYAGGSRSVRGYALRSLGPLDDDDDPLGGRSLLEINLETRIRLTESFGIVPFLDGGGVSGDELQNFSDRIRWGAGLGLRYYTPVGPLRLDVAVPLNKRETDDEFQFYISLGQAF